MKSKKSIARLLALVCAFGGACAFGACSGADKQGVMYELSWDSTYARVVGYDGAQADVTIKGEYKGAPVTTIREGAFDNERGLESITLPSSVTTIENSAFLGCENLTAVTVADNSRLAAVGFRAFYECSALKAVTFGKDSQLARVEEQAFAGCGSLISVAFGENSSLTMIGYKAFMDCGLISVFIPGSVTEVDDFAFYGCESLTSLTFGKESALVSVGYSAFADCRGLAQITFEDTVDKWNAVLKGQSWCADAPATQVVCRDGSVAL